MSAFLQTGVPTGLSQTTISSSSSIKMPFSANSKTNEVAADTVQQLHTVFGKHTGFRATHAKGLLVSGKFTPTVEAKSLSKAPHFNESVPIVVRFSNATGIPNIPDYDGNAAPRGMAVRFFLGDDRKHTDIICHSTPFFPTNNGEDFVAFLKAIASGAMPDFLGSHPAALAFVQAPKPTPKSFATDAFYGVSAYKLISADGNETFVRYRQIPDAGYETYDSAELEGKSPDFLNDEIQARLKSGSISFSLMAQIAEAGDQTNDATIRWPDDRQQVKLGTLSLDKFIEDSSELQRAIIFDPIPRVEGVEPSEDVLIDYRASVYLISGRERREAGGYHPENLPKFVPAGAALAT